MRHFSVEFMRKGKWTALEFDTLELAQDFIRQNVVDPRFRLLAVSEVTPIVFSDSTYTTYDSLRVAVTDEVG